jgi:hypothetical protein
MPHLTRSDAPFPREMFHTAGGWILAFEEVMHALLAARSGPVNLSLQVRVCATHPHCVHVDFKGHHEHIPWKEHAPVATARSLVTRFPAST